MNRLDKSQEQELETRLRESRSPRERQRLFEELSRIYAPDLQATATKWAYARKTPDPVGDAQWAHANAFIILAEKLTEMNFEEKTLEFYYKGRIWSELGHRETRRRRRISRKVPLEDGFDISDDRRLGVDDRLVAQESLQRLEDSVKNPAKKRILRAGFLKAEGHSWAEAAREVEWSGSHESLRVSFAKLRRELLETVPPGWIDLSA